MSANSAHSRLILLILVMLIVSCGNVDNFSRQKYTHLGKIELQYSTDYLPENPLVSEKEETIVSSHSSFSEPTAVTEFDEGIEELGIAGEKMYDDSGHVLQKQYRVEIENAEEPRPPLVLEENPSSSDTKIEKNIIARILAIGLFSLAVIIGAVGLFLYMAFWQWNEKMLAATISCYTAAPLAVLAAIFQFIGRPKQKLTGRTKVIRRFILLKFILAMVNLVLGMILIMADEDGYGYLFLGICAFHLLVVSHFLFGVKLEEWIAGRKSKKKQG